MRRERFTVQYVHHHCGERGLRDGAGVVAAVPLARVRDVQPTHGSVRQQVRLHAKNKKRQLCITRLDLIHSNCYAASVLRL